MQRNYEEPYHQRQNVLLPTTRYEISPPQQAQQQEEELDQQRSQLPMELLSFLEDCTNSGFWEKFPVFEVDYKTKKWNCDWEACAAFFFDQANKMFVSLFNDQKIVYFNLNLFNAALDKQLPSLIASLGINADSEEEWFPIVNRDNQTRPGFLLCRPDRDMSIRRDWAYSVESTILKVVAPIAENYFNSRFTKLIHKELAHTMVNEQDATLKVQPAAYILLRLTIYKCTQIEKRKIEQDNAYRKQAESLPHLIEKLNLLANHKSSVFGGSTESTNHSLTELLRRIEAIEKKLDSMHEQQQALPTTVSLAIKSLLKQQQQKKE